MTPPNSRRNLDEAIKRLATERGEAPLRVRDVLANTVVAQMLPDGVIKGGSAIKLRLGDAGTRFTTDLDFARSASLDSFLSSLQGSLGEGWEGFTGRPVQGRPARPKDVPPHYVMQPIDVKLSYKGKPWCTVKLEVGHNEMGDADEADLCLADDVAAMFESLGFPKPRPIPLMKLHYQIAQKLHALTEPGSRRAHDLIDLQLLAKNSELDYALINRTCKRLFSYRDIQPWPSFVKMGQELREAYEAQSAGISVLPSIEEAVLWADDLIRIVIREND
ncbi:nucleotidyl transferase AbiEii/AbiGii toxin family protein [Adlercreutzia sp. ZJ138]|uniref:nucleotidyl transferase AbiEii/AbiGii toxin family protein n=1 Tax=Adlercreutzia sp. ZJ138 TaxID=2709405 RepID=UPI0013EA3F49|nr:nucleotidyl transferase AbiEii/AbiGii toxin family protein [Adlercreutzia sp. ZJ138]